MANRTCSIDGCEQPTRARGWCKMHYQRWIRHGDPAFVPHALTVEQRFWSHVDRTTDGCWPWIGLFNDRRYATFGTGSRAAGTFRNIGTHVFALELRLDRALLPGMHALHTCDNRLCVRNDDEGVYEVDGVLRHRRGHLWEGTTQDNSADMRTKGRAASATRNGTHVHPETVPRGERNANAKLTEWQVLAIRDAVDRGSRQNAMAAWYGVSTHTINQLVQRKTWTHI